MSFPAADREGVGDYFGAFFEFFVEFFLEAGEGFWEQIAHDDVCIFEVFGFEVAEDDFGF